MTLFDQTSVFLHSNRWEGGDRKKVLGQVEGRHPGARTMMNYRRRARLHVTPHHTSANTSHVSNPSRSTSPPRHVIDKAAVIFSALVLCWLCHRPLCDHAPTPPHHPSRFSTLVAASLSAERRGTVYISAKLALPFGPRVVTFQAFSWRCHPRQADGEVSAAGGDTSNQPTLTGCVMAAGFRPGAL